MNSKKDEKAHNIVEIERTIEDYCDSLSSLNESVNGTLLPTIYSHSRNFTREVSCNERAKKPQEIEITSKSIDQPSLPHSTAANITPFTGILLQIEGDEPKKSRIR